MSRCWSPLPWLARCLRDRRWPLPWSVRCLRGGRWSLPWSVRCLRGRRWSGCQEWHWPEMSWPDSGRLRSGPGWWASDQPGKGSSWRDSGSLWLGPGRPGRPSSALSGFGRPWCRVWRCLHRRRAARRRHRPAPCQEPVPTGSPWRRGVAECAFAVVAECAAGAVARSKASRPRGLTRARAGRCRGSAAASRRWCLAWGCCTCRW